MILGIFATRNRHAAVTVRIRLCGGVIVVAAVVGFLAARHDVASDAFTAVDQYERGVALVALAAVAVGLLHRPTGLGAAMFVLAAVPATYLLTIAASTDPYLEYRFVNYFAATLPLGLLGLFALLFGPRPDPDRPSPFDQP